MKATEPIDNSWLFDKSKGIFYEAYYAIWNDPQQNLSMITRYILFDSPLDDTKHAEVWAWFYDRNPGGADVAIIQRHPLSAARISYDKQTLKIGSHSGMEPGHVWGEVANGATRVQWNLNFDAADAIGVNRFPGLAEDQLFPKFYSPYCKSKLSGTVTVNGREYQLSNVTSTDGHYWNAHNLGSWSWGNGGNFQEDPNFLFEGIAMRFNFPSPTSSWMSFQWNGQTYTSDIVSAVFKHKELVSELEEWQFSAEFPQVKFTGRMTARPEDMILLTHPMPDGSFLYTTITPRADLVIDVQELRQNGWESVQRLTASSTCPFEVTKSVRNEKVQREFLIIDAA